MMAKIRQFYKAIQGGIENLSENAIFADPN